MMTRQRRRMPLLSLALSLFAAIAMTGLIVAPAHAEVRDGWCKKDEGLAMVVDFSHLRAEHWPNSRGYVVQCIVNPNLPENPASAALDATTFEHSPQNTGYVESILGLTQDNQTWGWVHGRNQSGTLSWDEFGPTALRADPQINGFEYFVALSSQYDSIKQPAVSPQFLNDNGGGGGGGGDPLMPGAPNQPGTGGGNGDELNPGAPNQVNPNGQSNPGGSGNGDGADVNPGAPGQNATAPVNPNASAAAGQAQTPDSSSPAVFSSESPGPGVNGQLIGEPSNWMWVVGALAVVGLGIGAGLVIRRVGSHKDPGDAPSADRD